MMLLTGGTGSLGQAIVREGLQQGEHFVVFSREEYLQWKMQRQLRSRNLQFIIGDVRDKEAVYDAMKGCASVIHAAALKHVPVGETQPVEVIKTNVLGSINVATCAQALGLRKVLAISSDKAVRAENTYGATKFLEEKIFLSYGFSVARFGNFWGSRGSVIEQWEEERESGVITVTDAQMERYWIGLDEAARFTLKCLNGMKGGEVFIPEMKAEKLGDTILRVAPECQWDVIGLRAGEKLAEELS